MQGLMQDWPLLIHRVIDYAATQHGYREVVSRSVEGTIHRTTYKAIHQRAKQVSQRLKKDGIGLGDRIATLAWNTWRHLEAWYGITGIGAIYHTINPRLFGDQIVWIANHAQDRILLTDLTFVPLLESLADRLPSIERYVILTDGAHMPQTKLKNAIAYEDWIAQCDGHISWDQFDEKTAAGLCYTSGTTGNPKGVLYSHRSNVLHSMSLAHADALGIRNSSVVLPVVPLFHANSWSLAFSCPMMGAKMVMPGAKLDGASLHELMEAEGVTMAAGVPTVWLGLLAFLQKENKKLSTTEYMLVGGSACPRALIETYEKDYGLKVVHAWGMTEMSPIGSLGAVKDSLRSLDQDALIDLKAKQGYAPFGVEMKITNDAGQPLPWDGKTFGRLKVAGFAVTKAYFGLDESVLDDEGFFDTGDVATIDANGYMQITDRSKDVIKSGGEWISSIDLENLAIGHPDVAEAAVIGIAHSKWSERPLLILVPKEGRTINGGQILSFMEGKIAKWWLPDDVQTIAEIPHTATGKINKLKLRELFAAYKLPNDA
jgi:fatty-acyl-CoA synthase